MTQRLIDVEGGSLFFVDDGAGPPIILLHAGVADHRAWSGVAPLLLASGYRVIAYDARGFGASTTRDVDFSHPADLIALMDALAIERAALVGNSRGGMIAFDTAIGSPERVVAVVGVGAGVGGFDGGATPAEIEIFEAYERIEGAKPLDPAALTDFETGIWLEGPNQPAGRVDPDVREAFRAMAGALNERQRVGREIRLDPPANDRLADLRCPVLAIAGALDFSEVARTAERLEVAAPDASAVVWPDVAHMIGMEEPERLAAAIAGFLAPIGPWK